MVAKTIAKAEMIPPSPTTHLIICGVKLPITTLVVALLALFTIVIYAPTGTFSFISIDDDIYVYNHPQVIHGLTWEGIKGAFLPNGFSDNYWQPLTVISFMLDVEFFGINPVAHHTINWLFHLANAILLYITIKNLTGKIWESAFVSMLFAVHPLNVESVAWIAERKNVLSTFFAITSLLAYHRFTLKQTSNRYGLSLGLYALGLLTKPSLVPLPALLLLLDHWPLDRFHWPNLPEPVSNSARRQGLSRFCSLNRWILLEKLPFLALSIVTIIFTSLALTKHTNLPVSFQTVPLLLRIENICTSYVAYLGKLIYPAAPAFLYPFPSTIPLWQVIPAALLLIAISIIALADYKKRPWLTVGWSWFLIAMLPVSGIMQVGVWPKMADHLLYLPEIGLLIICVWGSTTIAERLKIKRKLRLFMAAMLIIAFAVTASKQVGYWRDTTTLLKQSLAVGGPHPFILDNISGDLMRKNRPLAALPYLNQALAMDPTQEFTMTFLGTAYLMLNRLDEAIVQFQHALIKSPGYKVAEDNLALATGQKGHFTEVADSAKAALALTPDSPELLTLLGRAYFYLGQPQNAVDTLRKSLRIKPENKEALNELGKIHLLYGKTRQSIALFQDALRIDPDFTEARNNLLDAKQKLTELQEGLEYLPEELRFN